MSIPRIRNPKSSLGDPGSRARVQAKIIPIGNSQGIRIPKPLLEQSGIQSGVELEVVEGRIVIHPLNGSRNGWEDAFKTLADEGSDQLLDEDLTGTTAFDQDEWEW